LDFAPKQRSIPPHLFVEWDFQGLGTKAPFRKVFKLEFSPDSETNTLFNKILFFCQAKNFKIFEKIFPTGAGQSKTEGRARCPPGYTSDLSHNY
jgi:hypothetical protein